MVIWADRILVEAMDAYAQRKGLTRSTAWRRLAQRLVKREERKSPAECEVPK